MNRWTAERWAAASGVAFAIVFVIANLIAGSPPHYNASPDKIGTYLHDHHKSLTIQALLAGVIVVLFLWFLSSFAGFFREAGQRRLSMIMFGAGVATVTLAGAGDALVIASVRLNEFQGASAASAFYAVSAFFYIKLFWAAAALAFATALATYRSGVFARWYAGLSAVGAVLFALTGCAMREHGFFSPAGAMPWIGFVGFALWVLVSSALLVQKLAPAATVTPAAAPAT
jgi:hypothetical protein